MILPTIATGSTFTTTWSKEKCTQGAVNALVLEKFKEVICSANESLSGYKTNQEYLKKGYWYGNDYAIALHEKEDYEQIEKFKNNMGFFHGHPPDKMEHTNNPNISTGKNIYGYTLKKGCKPSEALRSIRETVCFIDCLEAVEIAYYDALLEILGEERFDEIFSREESRFALSTLLYETPLAPGRLSKIEKSKKLDAAFFSSIRKGEKVFFLNIAKYGFKHIDGVDQGYHCICSEEFENQEGVRFVAFGLPTEGVSEEEICQYLVNAYNRDPIDRTVLYNDPNNDGFPRKDYPIDKKYNVLQSSNELLDSKIDLPFFKQAIEATRNQPGLSPGKWVGLQPFRLYLNAEKISSLLLK